MRLRGHRRCLTPDPASRRVWAAMTVTYLVWGSTFLAIRVMVRTIPPCLGGAIRFLAAGMLLGAFVWLRRGRAALRVPWREAAGAAAVGVVMLTGAYTLVAIAEQHAASGLAALLSATVPLWLIVFRAAGGNRPSAVTVAGSITGVGGVAVLVASGGTGGTSAAVIMLLIAALLWATGTYLAGRIAMPADPLVASGYEMLAASAGLALIAVIRGESFARVSLVSSGALTYLVVFGSLVAFTAQVWLLANARVFLVATYAFVNPLVAVLLGAVLLDEPLTYSLAAGGALIAAGVAMVVTSGERECGHAERAGAAQVAAATSGRAPRR